MIQYPAVWTLSCSFSTAFWLPNIRRENLFTPGCIMAPNCRCIKLCCLFAASISSKPTMVSSRSPFMPTELPWSFMFWLPMLFFSMESCLWNTLFPSAFSSLLLANELDLSSMFSKRTVSGRGGQTTRKTQEEPLEALLFHLMSFNCSAPLPPLRLVQTETELSWTWRIRFLKTAPPTASFSFVLLTSLLGYGSDIGGLLWANTDAFLTPKQLGIRRKGTTPGHHA